MIISDSTFSLVNTASQLNKLKLDYIDVIKQVFCFLPMASTQSIVLSIGLSPLVVEASICHLNKSCL